MSLRWPAFALLLAALLAPAQLHAQAAKDSVALEPVLVELAVGRYGSQTVSAYRSSGDALLPVFRLAEMAELRSLALAGGALELTLEPGRRQVMLDPTKWEIRTGDATIALTPADRRGEVRRAVSQHPGARGAAAGELRGELERALGDAARR